MTRALAVLAALAALAVSPARADAPVAAGGPVTIVAAENFYGDVARQVGGAHVAVSSILASPDQDPHLFEASPSVARALAGAKIVIVNGLGYDPWAERLVKAAPRAGRTMIVASELVGAKAGDNPHIWYDPRTMIAVAGALARALGAADPAHRADFAANAEKFRAGLAPLEAKIAALHKRFAGTRVAATEPVFGAMFARLGLDVRDRGFQLAVMNDTAPSPSDVARLESDLRSRRVRLLVTNLQSTGPMARRMAEIARAAHVPVVAVSETQPAGTDYAHWMEGALDAVGRALGAE